MIVVQEYARLTTVEGYDEALDIRTIPKSAFKWLLDQQVVHFNKGLPLIHIDGAHAIKLDSFVGVIRTPCGTQIEILPKTTIRAPDEKEINKLRNLLVDMIKVSFKLKPRQYERADLVLFKYPLPEWLIAMFLEELQILVRKGLRFNYLRTEEKSKFLRGQLDITLQLRQSVTKAHIFNVRHDIYSPDRPANRVLKKALNICLNGTKEPGNWRIANELQHFLDEVPSSKDTDNDLKLWATDSLMADYHTIKPWAELIVKQMTPLSQSGHHEGMSLLFPMEYLFEQYVAHHLSSKLEADWQLKTQATSKYLCTHNDRRFFQLRPDLLFIGPNNKFVAADTKWKKLNMEDDNGRNKYGLSQSDFYQLYAYGKKYMDGYGDMILIFPKYDNFTQPLPVFKYDKNLRLWVIPFDLFSKNLILNNLPFFEFFQYKNEYISEAFYNFGHH